MGRFRNKAIETMLRGVLYSLMKGAHCAKSLSPTGPPSSGGLPLLLFPSWGFVSGPQDALSGAVLSSHFPVSAALGLPWTEGGLGWEPPAHVLGSSVDSVVVGDENASFRESWEQIASSQAAARGGRAESQETVGAKTSSCSVLCSEASPHTISLPGLPPPRKSRLLSTR